MKTIILVTSILSSFTSYPRIASNTTNKKGTKLLAMLLNAHIYIYMAKLSMVYSFDFKMLKLGLGYSSVCFVVFFL